MWNSACKKLFKKHCESQFLNSLFFSQRSMLTFMALAGLINAYLMRLSLNITILKMVDKADGIYEDEVHDVHAVPVNEVPGKNDTPVFLNVFKHTSSTIMDGTQIVAISVSKESESNIIESPKLLITSVFYIAFALLHIPASFLSQKYGGKIVLNLGLFVTALCTLLTPIIVRYGGTNGLITLRIFMGIAEAPLYPALIYLLSRWIPENERARVSSIVFCGGQIGSIICNFITGFVFQDIKQKTEEYAIIFYIFGIVSILWNIAFHFLVYNTPSSHPRISKEEREYLQNEVGNLVKIKNFCQIPWTSMLASPAVLALIIAQMGHDWGFYLLSTEMPTYFEVILTFNYKDLAVYTSIPFFVSYLFSLLCGAVCDYIVAKQILTLTKARQQFTTIGAVMSASFALLIFYADYDKVAALIYFTLAMASMGAYYAGAQANFLDLCPNYSGALMGLVNGSGAICGFLVPVMTSMLTKNERHEESHEDWDPVFWISFIILSTTVLAYTVWGSAEVQSWNDNIHEDNGIKRTYRRFFHRKVVIVGRENK